MNKSINLILLLALNFFTVSEAMAERQPLRIMSYGSSIVAIQNIVGELPMERSAVLVSGNASEAYFRIFRQRVGPYPEVGSQFAACEELNGLTFKLFEITEDYFVKLAASSQENDLKTCRAKATEVNLRLPLVNQ